jgi:hypothetical protein
MQQFVQVGEEKCRLLNTCSGLLSTPVLSGSRIENPRGAGDAPPTLSASKVLTVEKALCHI